MLKFNKISLAEKSLTPVELAHLAGKATIKNGITTLAVGRFHMSNGGRCTMCAIDAAMQSLVGGEGDDANDVAPIVINEPSDITVKLEATLKRTITVPAGETTVDTGCTNASAARFIGKDTFDLSTGKATFTSASAVNRDVEFELDIVVADDNDNKAEDKNVAHQLQIMPDNPEGLLHFSIVAPVADVEDRNLNKATFEVRGAKPWKVIGEKPIVSFVVPPATPE